MATLNDTDEWVDVYQLEQTDPVVGGAPNEATGAGMDNIPHLHLAKRDRWLKTRVDQLLGQVVAASQAVAGVVKLNAATNSTSVTEAATPSAVKAAFDLATGRAPSTRAITGGGLVTGGGDLSADRVLTVPVATQAQAETGTDNATAMTPLRVKQAIAQQTATGVVPAGTVILHAGPTAPAGYLKANGAAVSRTTYAALWTAIGGTYGLGDGSTTFNLPDMRGMFPRAWDDGRGVDTGRGLGTFQDSQNQSHQHTGTTSVAGSHVHGSGASYPGGIYSQVADATNNAHPIVTATGAAGDHNHSFTTDASGGTEARPKNIALLACIKF